MTNDLASVSICCWPPDMRARDLPAAIGELREELEHLLDQPPCAWPCRVP